jgi:hypothetical protein
MQECMSGFYNSIKRNGIYVHFWMTVVNLFQDETLLMLRRVCPACSNINKFFRFLERQKILQLCKLLNDFIKRTVNILGIFWYVKAEVT